MIYLFPM